MRSRFTVRRHLAFEVETSTDDQNVTTRSYAMHSKALCQSGQSLWDHNLKACNSQYILLKQETFLQESGSLQEPEHLNPTST